MTIHIKRRKTQDSSEHVPLAKAIELTSLSERSFQLKLLHLRLSTFGAGGFCARAGLVSVIQHSKMCKCATCFTQPSASSTTQESNSAFHLCSFHSEQSRANKAGICSTFWSFLLNMRPPTVYRSQLNGFNIESVDSTYFWNPCIAFVAFRCQCSYKLYIYIPGIYRALVNCSLILIPQQHSAQVQFVCLWDFERAKTDQDATTLFREYINPYFREKNTEHVTWRSCRACGVHTFENPFGI